MGIVVAHMSMSLDGFIAGPAVSIANPMGVGGERLHQWLFSSSAEPQDEQVASEMYSLQTTGAVVIGHTTFTVGEAPWGEGGTFNLPCFVVTHAPRPVLIKKQTSFTFVDAGLDDAMARARGAAGSKNVNVMGANIVQQLLRAGQLDELHLNLIPVLLGGGTPLFTSVDGPVELTRTRTIETSEATHVTYRIRK